MTTRWTEADAAQTAGIIDAWVNFEPAAEIRWIAREARALSKLNPYELGHASDRLTELISRKRALIEYANRP